MASHIPGALPGKKGPLGKRYAKLVPKRHEILTRARNAAEVTIPHLVPREGMTGQDTFKTPFQGLGAEGLNLLTSKLSTGLFPPNTPFFRLSMNEKILVEFEAAVENGTVNLGGGKKAEDVRNLVDESLINTERVVASNIESTKFRVLLNELLRQLIVAGNVLLYDPDESIGETRLFKINSFVQRRDPRGNVIELITFEELAFDELSQSIQDRLLQEDPEGLKKMIEVQKAGEMGDVMVPIYNKLKRISKKRYTLQTEVHGLAVDTGGAQEFDAKDNPYLSLRWTAISGEDYGRGYVEEFLGDLISLENLTQTLLEGTAAMAKLLIMVDPGGTTDIDDITNAENGAVVHANEADVGILTSKGKSADFQSVEVRITKLEQRISRLFLLTSALRRDAERVTAEEVRLLVRELEEALGGVYPLLTGELQLPLVQLHLGRTGREGTTAFSDLDSAIEPEIITGLAALGRSLDYQRFRELLDDIAAAAATFPGIVDYVPDSEIINRLTLGAGVERKGLLLSDEEVAAQREASAQQQAEQAAALSGAEAAGATAGEQIMGAPKQ